MTVYRVFFRLPGDPDQHVYADFASLESAATFACVSDSMMVLEMPEEQVDEAMLASGAR